MSVPPAILAASLSALEKIKELRLGQLLLRAVREILQRPFAGLHFILAENQRKARTEFAGALESFAEFLFDRWKLDAQAGIAQSL